MNELFTMADPRPAPAEPQKPKRRKKLPAASISVLAVIVLGCLLCDIFAGSDPAHMDLSATNTAPCSEFLFGTDSMGRDIFSMIWHGGRISLFIGFFAAAVSAAVGILIGSVSGLSPKWLDSLLMRMTEIFLSIPSLMLIVFISAMLGKATAVSIAAAVGITGWAGIAKVVRAQVKKLRHAEYVIAARCMGAGFFRMLTRHLIPNLISSIMFMVVMNIRTAIITESTLSFMGIGLPLETISWGSMLSLAERSMLSGSWHSIVIPGIFLIATLLCITGIGSYLRSSTEHKQSNL